MQKKFITNLAFLLFINFLIKPFWIFGIDRTVQNVVGADAYGLYYALFNFAFMFNIFLDLGITNFNNRNISQNAQLLSKHFAGIVALRLILAVFYLALCMGLAVFLGYSIQELQLLIVLLINQVFAAFILYFRSNISGLQMFRTDSILSALDRFVMIIICSYLLWFHADAANFNISWFIYAQSAAYIVTAIIAFGIAASKAEFLRIRWNPIFCLLILKKSMPFALLIMLMAFYNRMDAVMIERMLPDGAEQAGVYAQAYRLLDASNMIAFLFAGLLLPMYSRLIKNKEDVSQLVNLSFSLIATIAIAAIVICNVFKTEIMDLLYIEHSDSSAEILAVLMFSFFAMATTYIYGSLLTANGSLGELNIMAASGLVLNLILNILLIPKFKALGAANATLITQGATALAQVIIAIKIFDLKINYSLCLRVIALAGLSAGMAIFLSTCDLVWWISAMFTGIFVLVAAIGLRLLNPVALSRILQERDSSM